MWTACNTEQTQLQDGATDSSRRAQSHLPGFSNMPHPRGFHYPLRILAWGEGAASPIGPEGSCWIVSPITECKTISGENTTLKNVFWLHGWRSPLRTSRRSRQSETWCQSLKIPLSVWGLDSLIKVTYLDLPANRPQVFRILRTFGVGSAQMQ